MLIYFEVLDLKLTINYVGPGYFIVSFNIAVGTLKSVNGSLYCTTKRNNDGDSGWLLAVDEQYSPLQQRSAAAGYVENGRQPIRSPCE